MKCSCYGKYDDFMSTGGLDVIFMPGLAFTRQGARLGRGKGYYDSYLTKCRNSGVLPRTVALIFHQQLVDVVPMGEHDMLVQEVVCASADELFWLSLIMVVLTTRY